MVREDDVAQKIMDQMFTFKALLQVEDRGTWHEVRSLGANRREAVITPYDAGFIAFSTFHLRVVAVLPDGTTIPSTDTTKVRVERLGLGAAYCA